MMCPEENARDDRGSKNSIESNIGAILEEEEDNCVLAESPEVGADSRNSVPVDWNQPWENREDEEPIVPRYENRAGSLGDRDDRDPVDHDSGMCSIGSRDSESSERDRWRRLYRMADSDPEDNAGQISSVGGRRFWTTGGYKYHTFGGIRIRPAKAEDPDDDLEDESCSPDDRAFEDRVPEFARLKFQTFGGIKRSRKIDRRRIPNYRRIRLRPILPEAASVAPGDLDETQKSANIELHSYVKSKISRDQPTNLSSTTFDGFASFEHSTSSTFEESDWQDERNNVTYGRMSVGYAQIGRNRSRASARTSSTTKRRNPIRKKNMNSSLPNEDDEWQEIDCTSDEIIMNKFLKDVSRKRETCAFNDDNVTARGRKTRFGERREVLEGGNSEKLEKPTTRATERDLKSSKKS